MMDMWRRLRLRTKVLVVVVFLIVVGALSPDEEPDTTANDDRASGQAERDSEQTSAPEQRDEDADSANDDEEVADVAIVPALRSQSVKDARRALQQAGLTTEVVRKASWEPAGTVLRQGVKAGTSIAGGGLVTLVVAAPMPRVPGVVGRAVAAGRTTLARAGFEVSVVTKEVPTGQSNVVLSQSPPGTQQAPPGSAVRLVISKVVPPVAPLVNNCTSGYRPCLPPAPDYDCAGGSGDGPRYATGPIYVTGDDPYDLDSEGDGIACEA